MPVAPSNPLSSGARRRFLASTAAVAAAGLLGPAAAAETFEPQLGRVGRDVMWLPTPDSMIERLLRMAGAGPQDKLVDLGSGDGRFVIAAARDFGTPGLGVEYDAKMVEYARGLAEAEGVADQVKFAQGDVFETDFSYASIVAMYLLPTLNLRLRPQLLAMAPGTRIVTHAFDMGAWTPDERTEVQGRDGHLWIVPANAGGVWRAEDGTSQPLTLELEQTFQRVQGLARWTDLATSLREPRLSGNRLQLAYTDPAGELQQLDAAVEADTLRGVLRSARGERALIARRVGEAPAIGGSGAASNEEMQAAAALLGEW
ncbi:SAM-dependent methyltransferase [Verticiella sediminum]|uniref:SAM-dependent methyltransferase n=1 Tax=Verticiella sediminum TaxID=1247510 RepID=UPI0014792573|nr:class I SAM-dependent methyltransferase [Verticiella sediminum]